VQVQFFHQVGSVPVHGLGTEEKQFCDLFAGVTFGDQFQDLPLPGSQGIPGGFFLDGFFTDFLG